MSLSRSPRATNLTVFLLGETGTGKSLAAQAIHELSARSKARPHQIEGAFAIVPLEDHLCQYLTRVLNHTNGVISGQRGAARLLGVHPNTLRSRLRKLGIPFRKKERRADGIG